MKTATIFYLTTCPYCIKGRKALNELQAENPAYAAIEAQWIEESQNAALADTYDYYSVPSIFDGKKKLFECQATMGYDEIKEGFRQALDKLLA